MNGRRWSLLAGAAALALSATLVACGGSGASPPANPSATLQAFETAANAAVATQAALETVAAQSVTVVELPGPATPVPAVSGEPAAGVCAGFQGEIGEIVLHVDVPAPRCARVTPSQRVRIVNARSERVQIELGPFAASLGPGEAVLLDAPLGDYLGPGDHVLLMNGQGFGEMVVAGEASPSP